MNDTMHACAAKQCDSHDAKYGLCMTVVQLRLLNAKANCYECKTADIGTNNATLHG